MSTPIVEKKKGISPVWILPIIAMCVGGWLLFKSYQDAGIDITLHVSSATGITAGKTPVIYKGVQVGLVKTLHVSPDLMGVNLTIETVKNAEPYLVEDIKFWVEKVDIEAGRITGLETLLSGSYIGMELGSSDKPARSFIALPQRPPIPESAAGLHLTLQSDALYSVQNGSGIYHKNIVIGSVQSHTLNHDGSVSIKVFIKPEYSQLVKEGSRFWNASGISVTGGITDLKVHIASLAAIIKGGIMMETPPELHDGPPAKNDQTFTLYEDFTAAEYGISMTLELFSGEGIDETTTKVMYRGMELGHVTKMVINPNKQHTVTATLSLDPRADIILNSGTEFYLVQPEFSLKGIKHLDTLIKGTYITFIPGQGKPQDHFIIRNKTLPSSYATENHDGLIIKLKSDDLGSLNIGSPILYKRFPVGRITDIVLREKQDDVILTGVILKQYAPLVKQSSSFYNSSGIEFTASLSGVKIQTGSLETLVAGGVSFYTPNKSKPAKQGATYSLYKDFDAAKNRNQVKVIIHFNETVGLRKGIKVKYNDIAIGEVTYVRYEDKMTKVRVTARLDQEAKILLRTETNFWLVRPEFSLTGTQHLDTIISGPYIELSPGQGKATLEFDAVSDKTTVTKNLEGLRLVLEADDLFSLKVGSAVYYRRVKVGEVSSIKLSPAFSKVLVEVIIDYQYVPIIRENTVFWNASGIHVTGGIFSGISVNTESLEALMAGGIALATPDNAKMGKLVRHGHRYPLHAESKEEWLQWQPNLNHYKH